MAAKPKRAPMEPDLKDYDKATIRVMLDAARALYKHKRTQKTKTQIAILTAEYGSRRA